MQKRKISISGKNVVVLIAGILLVVTLAAQCAFAEDEATKSDGRDVEITYLNDASMDEELLLESASEEGILAWGSNYTSINSPDVTIEGVEDQIWTGSPITLPNLRVKGPGTYYVITTYNENQYTVTYEDNIGPGTAKVTITGAHLGNFNWSGLDGSVTKEFKIIKKEPETGPDPVPQNSITLPNGTSVTAGSGASKATYTVTGNNTVSFIKSKAGKKATSAKVPDTISFSGLTFKVTKVAKKAFSGMSKLKKVTIGENVTAIGANAFEKCTKLKTLVVKSTSLQAAKCKNCLKGSSIKTVKVPAAVKKTYKKKIFVKKICGLKVTVK